MEPFDRCVGCNSTRLTAVETLPALIVGQHGSDQCCTSDVTQGGGRVLDLWMHEMVIHAKFS